VCASYSTCPIENPEPENLAELKLRLEARRQADNFTHGA